MCVATGVSGTWEEKLVECEEGVGVNLFTVVVTRQRVVNFAQSDSRRLPFNEKM